MRSSRRNRFREQTKEDYHRPCGGLRRHLVRHGNPSAGSTGMDSGKHPRRSFCPCSFSRLSPPAIFYCRLCLYRAVSDSSSGRCALYLRPDAARAYGQKTPFIFRAITTTALPTELSDFSSHFRCANWFCVLAACVAARGVFGCRRQSFSQQAVSLKSLRALSPPSSRRDRASIG